MLRRRFAFQIFTSLPLQRMTSRQAEFHLTPRFRYDVIITEQVRLVLRRCPLRTLVRTPDYSDRAFRRFLQSLQADFGVVSRVHGSFPPVSLLFITVSAFFNLPATTWLQFFKLPVTTWLQFFNLPATTWL